jgi:hypothetical protein
MLGYYLMKYLKACNEYVICNGQWIHRIPHTIFLPTIKVA